MNSRHSHDCVYPADIQASRTATEKLIALGHRHIVFYDPTTTVHYSASDRRTGYRQAMLEVGLEPNCLTTAYRTTQGQIPNIEALFDAAPRPTAMLLNSHRSIEAVCTVARSRGLKVPEDLSLIIFHHVPGESTVGFISRMVVPYEKMGQYATRLLLQRIEGKSMAPFPQL